MSKHTAGLWQISKNGFTINTDESFIVDCNSVDISNEECKANAHLIAAAPEMLETLEAVAKAFVDDYFLEGEPDRALKYIEQIQKLIRKAKGENV